MINRYFTSISAIFAVSFFFGGLCSLSALEYNQLALKDGKVYLAKSKLQQNFDPDKFKKDLRVRTDETL